MSTESKTRELEDEEFILPCYKCGVDIRTSRVVRGHDEEGNYVPKFTFDRCPDCAAKLKELMAECDRIEAEAKAKSEKTLADLIASIPKPKHEQAEFDMGLD